MWLSALHHRNFRLFAGGQAISQTGAWMQYAAMAWLTYELGHSTFVLGLVAFAGQIPTFFLAPVAGVLSDRFNRRRALLLLPYVALLQTIVDEDKRGRVMSLYTMAIMGTAPIGSLIAGGIANAYGTSTAILISGVCCLLGAVGFALMLPRLRKHVTPIYRRMGVLPAVVDGLEASAELQLPPEQAA